MRSADLVIDNRDPEIAGEAFFSVFTFVSELQIGLWSSAYFSLPDDLVERVPRRGVTGGVAPRSPARAGQVSWRLPEG